MLTQLAVRNVVLIEALDLDFGRGLGVLTGETGAGKSILLDALGLVLGNRAETALVRSGADQASVTASFEFATLPPALAEALEDAGVEIEPGEPLIIRRQVKADGGSKAFVNDQSASVGLLRNLAPILVELHGQHDDRGLVNPRGHRQLLDRFAGADTAKVARNWREWQKASEALEEARAAIDAASAEQDLLLAHLAELTEIAPQAGEEARLAEQRAAMQKGERLAGDLEELRHIWEGSESPLSELRTAARRLDRIAGEHKLLAEALGALDRAILEATEAEEKLEEAAEALVHDPAALDAAETRLFDLRALARKHRCEVDELPDKMREMRSQLDAIEGGEAQLDALRIAEREAFDAYEGAAVRLRKARQDARQGGCRRACAAEAGRSAFPDGRAAAAAGKVGPYRHGRGRIPDRDQSGRGLRTAQQDRQRRRAVALHPRAEGRARGAGRRGDDDLRRDRPRRRRGGRLGHRRTAGAPRQRRAGAGGDA